jgi:hypothetical protein
MRNVTFLLIKLSEPELELLNLGRSGLFFCDIYSPLRLSKACLWHGLPEHMAM